MITFIDNNAPIEEGMKVWIYPANEVHGGTIKDMTVFRVGQREIEFTLRWGHSRYGNGAYQPSRKSNLYSSFEAAKKQRDADRAEPRWMYKGKFSVGSVSAVCAYLAHKTGIEERNIQCHNKGDIGILGDYLMDAWYKDIPLEKVQAAYNFTKPPKKWGPFYARIFLTRLQDSLKESFRNFIEAQAQWQHFPRQKMFPFMHEPGYYRKADSLLPNDEIDDELYKPDDIFHVTTNLAGVIRAGQLKSRRQLGGVAGLGGGWNNEAPGLISATYQYDRALEIYHEFKYVIKIVNNRVKASEIWDRFISNNPYSSFSDEEGEGPIKDVIDDYVTPEIIANEYEGLEQHLDKTIRTSKDKYDFFQRLEAAFLKDSEQETEPSPQRVIGFTADFNTMKRLNPSQLAILQLVVKKDANIEHKPQELEMRIKPQDVAVVRYFQPR